MASNKLNEKRCSRLTITSKCAWCGKKFERSCYSEWGYTGKYDRVYCTYSCMRAAQKADPRTKVVRNA